MPNIPTASGESLFQAESDEPAGHIQMDNAMDGSDRVGEDVLVLSEGQLVAAVSPGQMMIDSAVLSYTTPVTAEYEIQSTSLPWVMYSTSSCIHNLFIAVEPVQVGNCVARLPAGYGKPIIRRRTGV